MASLYTIDREIEACVLLDNGEYLNTETGELLDEEALNALQMDRTSKLENIACLIKNLEWEKNGCKEQKDAFAKREKALDATICRLKGYLLESLKGEKFKTIRCSVTFRKSERVDIADESKIPQDYLTCKTMVAPDKAAIKEALKAGEIIEGCALVTHYNPNIK